MKAIRVSKRKLIVVGIFLAILIVGASIVFLVTRNKEITSNGTSNEADYVGGIGNKEFEAIEQTVNDYNKSEAERIEKLAMETESTEDLSSLSEDDKGKVALQVTKNKIASNDTAAAQIFIDYLMLRTDSTGIEASVYCYQLATTDAAKQACRDRLNEQARASGLVGPSENISDDYLMQKDGEDDI